eukprot:2971425-Rhodomonas_salina.2
MPGYAATRLHLPPFITFEFGSMQVTICPLCLHCSYPTRGTDSACGSTQLDNYVMYRGSLHPRYLSYAMSGADRRSVAARREHHVLHQHPPT